MDYLLFFTICVAATFSPGPALLLTVKNSAVYGVERAVSGILGNIAAMITMAGLSATGLGVLLLASESLFLALLTYALVTKKLKFWLIKEKVRATFNKVTGGIFIGFGLSLIISNKT